MKLLCKVFGHDPAFRQITLPKRWYCRRCGKRLGVIDCVEVAR